MAIGAQWTGHHLDCKDWLWKNTRIHPACNRTHTEASKTQLQRRTNSTRASAYAWIGSTSRRCSKGLLQGDESRTDLLLRWCISRSSSKRSQTWSGLVHCYAWPTSWFSRIRNDEYDALFVLGFGWSRSYVGHGIWAADSQNRWANSGMFDIYTECLF